MVSDNITFKGWVVMQRITKKDPRTGGLIALFAPVRVTSSVQDADAYILAETKQDIVMAKRDYRRVEVPIDISQRLISEVVNAPGVTLHAYAGGLKPSGNIILGRPRTDN